MLKTTILGGVVVSLWSLVAHAAEPVFPSAATQSMLNAHPGLRVMQAGENASALYGAVMASWDTTATPPQWANTDAFIQAFIANQANCDALGVTGATLLPDKFCTGKPMAKCTTSDDCAPGETCGNSILTGQGRHQVYRYKQAINGVPVYGTSVTIPVSKGAIEKISYIGIRLCSLPVQPIEVEVLTMGQAVTLVQQAFAHLTTFSGETLVLLEISTGQFRKAWPVLASGSMESWRVFIDASNGNVLNIENLLHESSVSGQVRGLATPGTAAPDPDENAPMEREIPGAGVGLYSDTASACIDTQGLPLSSDFADGEGFFILDSSTYPVRVRADSSGRWAEAVHCPDFALCNSSSLGSLVGESACTDELGPTTMSDPLFNPGGNEDSAVLLNAMIGVHQGHDWLKSHLSNVTANDRITTIFANVEGFNNAGGGGDSIWLGKGDEFYRNWGSIEIILHELGHVTQDRVTSLSDSPFNEGFADTFATFVLNSPTVGQGWRPNLPVNDATNWIRKLDAVDVRLNDVTTIPPWCSGFGGHCLGMALGGAFWDLRETLLLASPKCSHDLVTNCAGDDDCPVGAHCDTDVLAERIFANFMLIGDQILDESVLLEVLLADDDDGDLTSNPRTPHFNQIMDAFVGLHGWSDPFPLPNDGTVKVGWIGPAGLPVLNEDYVVYTGPGNLPTVILKTTAKGGFRVEEWRIGRVDGFPLDIGSIRGSWVGPAHCTGSA